MGWGEAGCFSPQSKPPLPTPTSGGGDSSQSSRQQSRPLPKQALRHVARARGESPAHRVELTAWACFPSTSRSTRRWCGQGALSREAQSRPYALWSRKPSASETVPGWPPGAPAWAERAFCRAARSSGRNRQGGGQREGRGHRAAKLLSRLCGARQAELGAFAAHSLPGQPTSGRGARKHSWGKCSRGGGPQAANPPLGSQVPERAKSLAGAGGPEKGGSRPQTGARKSPAWELGHRTALCAPKAPAPALCPLLQSRREARKTRLRFSTARAASDRGLA